MYYDICHYCLTRANLVILKIKLEPHLAAVW